MPAQALIKDLCRVCCNLSRAKGPANSVPHAGVFGILFSLAYLAEKGGNEAVFLRTCTLFALSTSSIQKGSSLNGYSLHWKFFILKYFIFKQNILFSDFFHVALLYRFFLLQLKKLQNSLTNPHRLLQQKIVSTTQPSIYWERNIISNCNLVRS